MTPPAAGSTRRYETTVRDVEEVSVVGGAELGSWAGRMERDGLRPLPVEGRAEITLLACSSTYMGIRFRELALAVTVAQPTSASALHGAYLVKAWNSVRFFAFVERAWFKTPYEPARVSVDAGPPAAFSAERQGTSLLTARMAGRPGQAEAGDDAWEGTVFLPGIAGDRGPQGRLYFVRLRGVCREHPFGPADALEITRGADETLDLLARSDFRPRLWRIRHGAEA
jgi:hypothetical protein